MILEEDSVGYFSAKRAAAMAGAAMAAGLMAQPGAAQLTAAPADKAADATAGDRVEEIVVTAQRREESLQRVPVAITALTAAHIEAAGIRSSDDLQLLAPSLNISRNSNGLIPFLRGVGTFSSSPGQEASVALYVDGVYVPQPTATLLSFTSVERIEVLKGPQGTLFGRNSSGGLINVITRNPDHDALEASLTYGNYGTVEGRLYGAMRLNDTLGTDLAVYGIHEAGGYGHNLVNGDKTGQHREIGLRNKWRWTPSDTVTAVITADYSNLATDQGDARRIAAGKAASNGYVATGGYYDIASDLPPFTHTRSWGTSGDLRVDLGGAEIVSITGYRNVKSHYTLDTDATPILTSSVDVRDFSRSLSQELQIKSAAGSPIKWIGGLYYFNYINGYEPFITLSTAAPRVDNMHQKLNSYSAFAQVDVPLGQKVTATAGARYTHDNRKFSSVSTSAARTIAPVEAKFGEWSWRGALNYQMMDNIMAYASVSRGFKAGLFDPVTPTNVPVKPEINQAYEAGLKTELLDRHLRLNLSAFHYDLSNVQISAQFGAVAQLLNAAKVNVNGAEIEGSAAIAHGFSADFGLSFLNSKFASFPNSLILTPAANGRGNTAAVGSVAGNHTTRAPRFTSSLSLIYSTDIDGYGLRLAATGYHQSKFYWQPDNRVTQPAYDVVNADMRLTLPNGHWQLIAFARNLLSEKYAVTFNPSTLGDIYSPAAPRTYGVGAGLKF
jgi:iron complex outermembrane receptor protein